VQRSVWSHAVLDKDCGGDHSGSANALPTVNSYVSSLLQHFADIRDHMQRVIPRWRHTTVLNWERHETKPKSPSDAGLRAKFKLFVLLTGEE
jgi:hypothetical protein